PMLRSILCRHLWEISDNDDDVIDLRAIGQDKSFASFSERIEEILHIVTDFLSCQRTALMDCH
ncbi:MAG: hypothetical protein SOV65_00430, partial [Phocaeicola vulgatus]|nr:hypothetical protein [Phocaeicola vulgatus]